MGVQPTRYALFETVYDEDHSLNALLYVPQRKAPGLPACVLVHGGAWVGGDRYAAEPLSVALAGRGVCVFAIDTRLAPQHAYPCAVRDVERAARFFREKAVQFGCSPANVGVVGVSSGGFLALDAVTGTELQGENGKPYFSFLATASGVLNPQKRYEMAESIGEAEIMMCHRAFFRDMGVQEEASRRVMTDREGLVLPPALFFQGENDERVPAGTANAAEDFWKRKGADAKATVYADEAHAIWGWSEGPFDDMASRIARLASGYKDVFA